MIFSRLIRLIKIVLEESEAEKLMPVTSSSTGRDRQVMQEAVFQVFPFEFVPFL